MLTTPESLNKKQKSTEHITSLNKKIDRAKQTLEIDASVINTIDKVLSLNTISSTQKEKLEIIKHKLIKGDPLTGKEKKIYRAISSNNIVKGRGFDILKKTINADTNKTIEKVPVDSIKERLKLKKKNAENKLLLLLASKARMQSNPEVGKLKKLYTAIKIGKFTQDDRQYVTFLIKKFQEDKTIQQARISLKFAIEAVKNIDQRDAIDITLQDISNAKSSLSSIHQSFYSLRDGFQRMRSFDSQTIINQLTKTRIELARANAQGLVPFPDLSDVSSTLQSECTKWINVFSMKDPSQTQLSTFFDELNTYISQVEKSYLML